MLVSGEDEASHFKSLEKVFNCLEKHSIRLKQEKCCFLLRRVDYLGHQISEEGIQPLANKVSAIIKTSVDYNGRQSAIRRASTPSDRWLLVCADIVTEQKNRGHGVGSRQD